MAANSPAVERVVSVLNFFAEHRPQAFNLSQVIRSLKLNRATCHGLLSALVDNGYLFRNSDKTYVLGPTLLAIGRNAEESFSALDVMRLELRKLADEFNVIAVALAEENEQIVIRDRAASRSHLGWAPPAGVTYSFYPWGLVFVSLLRAEELETWIDTAASRLSKRQREELHERALFVRRHGFSFWVHDPERAEPINGSSDRVRNPGRMITELDPAASYQLSHMEAPIVNDRGMAEFVIALHNFDGLYSGAEINAIAERLKDSCRHVTTYIGGRLGDLSF